MKSKEEENRKVAVVFYTSNKCTNQLGRNIGRHTFINSNRLNAVLVVLLLPQPPSHGTQPRYRHLPFYNYYCHHSNESRVECHENVYVDCQWLAISNSVNWYAHTSNTMVDRASINDSKTNPPIW